MASKVKVNTVETESGSTLTLGKSGDTVTLASGASQSGFGRTGTVDWDTTAKTASFTAVSGNGYFVNTTSASLTVTLPASPSAGNIVAIKDYALTFDTNNLTLDPGTNKIEGSTTDMVVNTEGRALTLVYLDSTQGWKIVNDGNSTAGAQAAFVTATGGTITTCGNFKIHTFTGPGTFCVSCAGNSEGSNTVDYLVVAGGAGGGGGGSTSGGGGYGAGGGGAGGYRESGGTASGCYTVSPLGSCVSALPVTAQGYPITVGGGGSGGSVPAPSTPETQGASGSNSVFSTITSAGGGGGGAQGITGLNGGSGGGRSTASGSPGFGAGNTPPVSPPQGKDGGSTPGCGNIGGGGGGGATVAGTNGGPTSNAIGGAGGNGATSSINATPTARAGGGGGGGGDDAPVIKAGGVGGTGGGAAGGQTGEAGSNGTTNTGGGGGAGGGNPGKSGGSGGSGIVIIRYKYQ